MKATLFAKGRGYSGKQICPATRKYSSNEVVQPSVNRVIAPSPIFGESVFAQFHDKLPNSEIARGILSATTNSLLHGYQRDIDRKNDVITKQRQTIKKLQSSAINMTDLLKSQSELNSTLKSENGDLQVSYRNV